MTSYIDELLAQVDAAIGQPDEDFAADPDLQMHGELAENPRRHATSRPPAKEGRR